MIEKAANLSLAFMITSLITGSICLAEKPNVLFICVDDMRPELGCYGMDWMKTPRIDSFAETARVFKRHYVQVPTCGASRHAMLTGLHPGKDYELANGPFKKNNSILAKKKAESLPHLFKNNGYCTVAIGKVSHSNVSSAQDLPRSWSETKELERLWGKRHNFVNAYAEWQKYSDKSKAKGPAFEAVDVKDDAYPDGKIAELAIQALEELQDKPFFLAVGFMKPHLPFNAPKKYWDLYDPAKIPQAVWEKKPQTPAFHKSFELMGQYDRHPEDGLENKQYRQKLKHGYCAAVSYVDAQIGKVLAELKRRGLDKNTIVVIWGDHGWHLGENRLWGKHTSFETSMRSTLIIRTPEMKVPGTATDALIESIDIYPTLSELCDIKLTESLDGDSFTGVLKDPKAKGPQTAISHVGTWGSGKSAAWASTIRTDRYRYTEWRDKFQSGKVIFRELYDYKNDPQESSNIASKAAELSTELSKLLAEKLK